MVHRIHTSAGDAVINYELAQLENELKKIQPDFKMDEMIQKKKVCLSDYPRIQKAVAEHCVLGHYMFSFKNVESKNVAFQTFAVLSIWRMIFFPRYTTYRSP